MKKPIPCVTFLNNLCPHCQMAILELKTTKNGYYEMNDHFECPHCKRIYNIRWESVSDDLYRPFPEVNENTLDDFVESFGNNK